MSADKEFGVAIRLFQNEGLQDRLAESYAAYAEVLEARRDPRGAGRHWKKAAKLALREHHDSSEAAGAV